jgi:class 3 adenylate cyclase
LSPSDRRGIGKAQLGVVTLLFTDLVGSSKLFDALGDDAADEARRRHFALLRSAVKAHHGIVVKDLGDGLMATFASSVDAVTCAIAMQQAVNRQKGLEPDTSCDMRIGLHVGEPIREHDDYFGQSVVIARRLCECAGGGEIIASELVQRIVEPRGRFHFTERGSLVLKGITTPIAASEVVWDPADAFEVKMSENVLPAPAGHRSTASNARRIAVVTLSLLAVAAALFIAARRDQPAGERVASADVLLGPGLEFDRFAWLNSLTGRGLLTGTVACAQATRLRLDVDLVQTSHGSTLERSTSRVLECDGMERFLISVSGPFEMGAVGYDATVRSALDETVIDQRSNSVTLRSCTIIGTLDDDELSGTRHNDRICGMTGDDVIVGGVGRDELRGSDGDDVIRGEDGKDLLTGGDGKDALSGGRGHDRLHGDRGVDRLRGGLRQDVCSGGSGFDQVLSCEVEE